MAVGRGRARGRMLTPAGSAGASARAPHACSDPWANANHHLKPRLRRSQASRPWASPGAGKKHQRSDRKQVPSKPRRRELGNPQTRANRGRWGRTRCLCDTQGAHAAAGAGESCSARISPPQVDIKTARQARPLQIQGTDPSAAHAGEQPHLSHCRQRRLISMDPGSHQSQAAHFTVRSAVRLRATGNAQCHLPPAPVPSAPVPRASGALTEAAPRDAFKLEGKLPPPAGAPVACASPQAPVLPGPRRHTHHDNISGTPTSAKAALTT